MIFWRKASLAVLGIAVIHLLMYTAYASTIDVGQGAKFSKIQDAVDRARPGDIINVTNGTYFENVNITKPLTLMGMGNTVIDASGQPSALVLSANGITVEGYKQ